MTPASTVSPVSPVLLRGYDALEAAERGEAVVLCKHADPTEGAREGLSLDEAREIAREDVGLVYAVLA